MGAIKYLSQLDEHLSWQNGRRKCDATIQTELSVADARAWIIEKNGGSEQSGQKWMSESLAKLTYWITNRYERNKRDFSNLVFSETGSSSSDLTTDDR
jgi:hypothetical protein